MKLIVISAAEQTEKEHELINTLFEQGLKSFHLRKSGYTMEQMQDFLKGIQPKFLRRIIVHSHYELIGKYNLAGIHLNNEALRSIPEIDLKDLYKTAKKKNLSVSGSIHSLAELSVLPFQYDYVLLSPVFDSISKAGYKSKLSHSEITEALENFKKSNNKTQIVALGGIEADKIEQVIRMNFDGIALLGIIWSSFMKSGNILDAAEIFKTIKEKCQTADHTL
ncbi:MAG: thiamine phosphate synthase [Cytophagaceae bacterium]